MKKLLSLALAAALMLIFTACQQTTNVYLDRDGNISVLMNGDNSSAEDASSEDTVSSENESQKSSSSEEKTASDSSSKTESGDTSGKKPENSSSKEESKPSNTQQSSGTQKPSDNKDSGDEDDSDDGEPEKPQRPDDGDNDDKPQAPTEYTVTFNPDNGAKSFNVTTQNCVINKPQDPVWAGYKFLGWYESGSSTPWDFSKKISGDVTLVAEWEIVEFKVTFNPKNEDETFTKTTVNHMVEKPENPKKKNCDFSGWYIEGTSTKWDFNKEITEDINLVAEWEIAGDHSPIIPF